MAELGGGRCGNGSAHGRAESSPSLTSADKQDGDWGQREEKGLESSWQKVRDGLEEEVVLGPRPYLVCQPHSVGVQPSSTHWAFASTEP